MESLPYLVLEKIVHLLSPQDLARCSAVCRKWREIFNQDWVWEPLCDSELEERLQTIPSVVAPAFVTPIKDDSTLAPICQWRLAFMREKHLWENWRKRNEKDVFWTTIPDIILSGCDFINDTLVVVWHRFHIKILDVSSNPPVTWAELHDESILIHKDVQQFAEVVDNILVVEGKGYSIYVYHVHITNKSIEFKFCTPNKSSSYMLVKEHKCLFTTEDGSNKINIYDLNSGNILKEEAFPMKINSNKSVLLWDVQGSSACDYIAVSFEVKHDSKCWMKLYIYNIKQLMFLPDVVFDLNNNHCRLGTVALYHQWLAYYNGSTLAVYNLDSKEDVFHSGEGDKITQMMRCDNSFVFNVETSSGEQWLKIYSPFRRSLTTFGKFPITWMYEKMSNKFFTDSFTRVWRLCGKTAKCEEGLFFPEAFYHSFAVNKSCSRAVMHNYHNGVFVIRYCW